MSKRSTNALREYKQTITLNPMQKEVNALRAPLWVLYWETPVYLYKMANPGPRVAKPQLFCVQFGQTIASADYIWLLYSVFYDFVGTPPRVQNIHGGSARDRKYIWFRTFGNIDFKFYYDLFYKVETAGRSC